MFIQLKVSSELSEIMKGPIAQSSSNLSADSSHGNEPTETIPLIGRNRSQSTVANLSKRLRNRYWTTRKCITSKAGLLILFWTFAVVLSYSVVLSADTYLELTEYFLDSIGDVHDPKFVVHLSLLPYGFISILECFYPLAGFLADTKFGRHKTITFSSYILLLPIFLVSFAMGLIMLAINFRCLVLFSVGIGSLCILSITSSIGIVGFNANIIQFGMDQLHDSPAEDQSLLIHWFVWIHYVNVSIIYSIWNPIVPSTSSSHYFGLTLLILIPLLVTVLLIVTLCVARRRRRWFLIEPGKVNPYKLVYRVTKFASQHKIPVRRSAFTYCEDELPSGLDLGKKKYGGPFTTEEVEDVKAFYGIFKVLFSFGTVFFLDSVVNSTLPELASLSCVPDRERLLFKNETILTLLFSNSLLSPVLVVICIPLYLFLIRPFMSRYVPGMLKRMGLGMLLVLLSLVLTFALDIAFYPRNETPTSNNHTYTTLNEPYPPANQDYFLHLNILSALSNMLIYIGVFEFICSQSPTSMKGTLIGLLFAIRGLFQFLSVVVIAVTISISWQYKNDPHDRHDLPSCGFVYYLISMIVGISAFFLYVHVARKYKYRVRDEPSKERQYAEEYYSKPQEDDDYDSDTEI